MIETISGAIGTLVAPPLAYSRCNMCASAIIANNLCVDMPSGEAAGQRGNDASSLGRPQQRFADILPLASDRTEPKTDKSVSGEASIGCGGSGLSANARVSGLQDVSEQAGRGALVFGVGLAAWVPPELAPDVKKAGLETGIGKGLKGGPAQSTSMAVTREAAVVGRKTGASSATGRQEQSKMQVSSKNGLPIHLQVSDLKGFTTGKPPIASTSQSPRLVHGNVDARKSGVPAGLPPGPAGVQAEMRASGASRAMRRGTQPAGKTVTGGDGPGEAAALPRGVGKSARDASRSDTRPGTFPKAGMMGSAPTAGRDPIQPGPPFTCAGDAKGIASVHPAVLAAPSGETAALSRDLGTEVHASTGGATARSPAQSVGEQILDSVRASLDRGDNQVVVRLRPPELGTVLVRFRENGAHITGRLEVSRNDTRQEIEQVLPPVLRNLQQAGIQVEKLEVVVSAQPERDHSGDQLQQDAWPQHQHGSGQDRAPAPAASWGESHKSSVDSPADSEGEPRAGWLSGDTHSRIDMLL